MREIYTSQYRYSGENRFDITVKGNDNLGHHFAPSWRIVMDVKKGNITERDYENIYTRIAHKALENARLMNELNELFPKKIVLVCFCKSNSFCHRYILARIMEEKGFGKYLGEKGV